MQKYKIHKDKNINSLIQLMAMRGKERNFGAIREEQLKQSNSILRARLLEKSEFLTGLMQTDKEIERERLREMSPETL